MILLRVTATMLQIHQIEYILETHYDARRDSIGVIFK